MSEKTKNLGLFKYIPETDGKQVFSIVEALNNNWDILDEKGAGSGFNLFDTKLVDHVLEGKEAEGWALQGTYVYKDAIAGSRYGYPDFYNKCIEGKDLGTATETVLGGNTVTLYINVNGHTFYDIADKEAIDAWYNTCGIAWYYGIDTENERIFLPRTKWFLQPSGEITEVNTVNEAGLPNISGSVALVRGDITAVNGCFSFGSHASDKDHGGTGTVTGRKGFVLNASLSSSIYGKSNTVQPQSINQLLYMCVGNTVSDTSWVDVVTQVEGGVKDLVDKTNEGLNSLSNASNALRQTQITNCLLEIPQRIKYTLEDGTLTIKAGSIVIVPYGTEDLTSQYPVGVTFLHENFKVYDTQFAAGKFFVWAELQSDITCTSPAQEGRQDIVMINITNNVNHYDMFANCASGTTSSTDTTYRTYFDTALNLLLRRGSVSESYATEVCSLPILIRTASATTSIISSVDQVFNGMGYIGSTIWVDKGVKGLIPNGKNADGTLNNEIREVSELYTYNIPENMIASRQYINLYGQQQSLKLATYGTSQVFMQENAPVCTNTHVLWLDTRANKFKYTENSGATWTAVNLCNIGIWNPVGSTGKLVHLQSNVLLSRGQSPEISSYSMPSSKYINLTLGASGTIYTAPANGWFYVWKTSTAVGEYILFANQNSAVADIIYSSTTGNQCRLLMPARKGDGISVQYSLNGDTRRFVFVYAEGEI